MQLHTRALEGIGLLTRVLEGMRLHFHMTKAWRQCGPAASWASYLVLTHADEVLKAELLVSHGVVSVCVQHDEGERQQVSAV